MNVDGARRSAQVSRASRWSSRTWAQSTRRRDLLELALIENIQREDLNPIDEAKAYRRLVDEFHLTQDAVASAVGKDRATVANTLRLLKLPPEVQNDVASSALSMGHARALLALPTDAVQLQAAREVKTRGLSVRETEALVKSALEGHEIGAPTPRQAKARPAPDVHTRAAEDKLKMQLGTRVRIVRKARGGRIEIDFTSEDELIRIYDALTEQESEPTISVVRELRLATPLMTELVVLRGMREQTRRRRARQRAERPANADRSRRADRLPDL